MWEVREAGVWKWLQYRTGGRGEDLSRVCYQWVLKGSIGLQLGGISGGCNSISFGVGERGLRIAGRWTEFLFYFYFWSVWGDVSKLPFSL